MEPREIKGLEIAAKLELVRSSGNIWYVPSQSNKQEKYTVALDDESPQCTCRDYEIRNRKCKHIFAVEYTIERENTADGQCAPKNFEAGAPVSSAGQSPPNSLNSPPPPGLSSIVPFLTSTNASSTITQIFESPAAP